MQKKKIVFFLNWLQGNEVGLTGGDRIWIELARRWSKKANITIVGSEEAIALGRKNHLEVAYCQSSKKIESKNLISVANLIKNTFLRTVSGTIFLLQYIKRNKVDIIYSSSDFLADSFPAFIAKMSNSKIVWVAGFYLFASPPWNNDSPYKGKAFLRGVIYWLEQVIPYLIIKKWADKVFVTSKPDVEKFLTKRRDASRIVVVQGGVDITESQKYLNSGKIIPLEKRKYLACFIGRLHYQKGVMELIDIWKLVTEKQKNAKLAIVGNGVLEGEVKVKIKRLDLSENIEMFGFRDGGEKYKIFKNSKIIVHPAIFDSGGMAAAEGMAWGLPGVSFDLESLKSYYPKGMVKISCFDLDKFADSILDLSENSTLYQKYSQEARDLIVNVWDWNKRANVIFQKLNK